MHNQFCNPNVSRRLAPHLGQSLCEWRAMLWGHNAGLRSLGQCSPPEALLLTSCVVWKVTLTPRLSFHVCKMDRIIGSAPWGCRECSLTFVNCLDWFWPPDACSPLVGGYRGIGEVWVHTLLSRLLSHFSQPQILCSSNIRFPFVLFMPRTLYQAPSSSDCATYSS